MWNETADFSFMINELNYILFLKCVEDSSCGLPSDLSRAAEHHICLQTKTSLGGSSFRNRRLRELKKLLLGKCSFLILKYHDYSLCPPFPMRGRFIIKIHLIHILKILFHKILHHLLIFALKKIFALIRQIF